MATVPLILLHGALGSSAHFEALAGSLAPRPVYRLNFSGHGGEALRTAFSIAGFAEEVLNFMDDQSIGTADFFGYSMGGYIALYLAAQHPSRVGRITTLGTKFDWTPESAARETERLDPDVLAVKVPRFAAALAERHAPADWKEVVRRTADLMRQLGASPALQGAVWDRIDVPVTIARGELDAMVTAEESRAAVAALRHAVYVELPDTKHPIEQVDPALLTGLAAAG